MTNSRTRFATLCVVSAVFALAGCSATPTTQSALTGSETSAPAMPQVNQDIAARLAFNAMNYSTSGVQLGAGDRFGQQLHSNYVATVQSREGNQMYAEVPIIND